ncbi:MAG: potassium transporter Trk [Vicingaceae bacterium]|jgi:trk system potassium uptake protein TrkA|nr:MAG: potassium transporter Trk [Vicingaceae bacterium]
MKGYKYAVIGLGLFGTAIAKKLAKKGAEVLAIDNNEDHIDEIKDEVAYAVCLDATDKKALKSQNIEDYDAVVVAIGENFEALLLCVVYLQELNIKRIIARANGIHQRKILEKIGIKEILSPEDEVGNVVAERLLNPNLLSVLQFPDNYEIAELQAPENIINRSLKDINLEKKYNLKLITIKRSYEVEKDGEIVYDQHIIGMTTPETTIYDKDTIVIFGKEEDIQKFLEINS